MFRSLILCATRAGTSWSPLTPMRLSSTLRPGPGCSASPMVTPLPTSWLSTGEAFRPAAFHGAEEHPDGKAGSLAPVYGLLQPDHFRGGRVKGPVRRCPPVRPETGLEIPGNKGRTRKPQVASRKRQRLRFRESGDDKRSGRFCRFFVASRFTSSV